VLIKRSLTTLIRAAVRLKNPQRAIQKSARFPDSHILMAPAWSIARHGVQHPPRWRIWRILAFVLALPILLPASCVLYIDLVPAHSASVHIKEANATVTLSFYWLWNETASNSGRFITVRSPRGTTSHQMCGFDWAHQPRTRVYLTDDRRIAIQGLSECSDFVSPDLVVTQNVQTASKGWRYLGAFDLVLTGGAYGVRHMRFIPAER
jgi:hypothetical protein